MSKTYNNILDALHCSTRTWDKVKNHLDRVSILQYKGDKSYRLYYEGVFLGVFIDPSYIDLEELKKTEFNFIKKSNKIEVKDE